MEKFFEVRTTYEKLGDNGDTKKVTEVYLADATTCTEAELRITNEIQPYSNGEFNVVNVRKTKIAELFERNLEGHWYACRLAMMVGEKRIPVLIYVKAVDVKDAEAFTMLQLKAGMQDWVVVSVTETKVIDVFMHE